MVAETLASLRRSRPAHHLRVIRQRLGIAPVRSDQPYATHLPVLIALGRELRVRRVLELGAGEHSTMCFLDTSVFPHLECLVSVENDPSGPRGPASCSSGTTAPRCTSPPAR